MLTSAMASEETQLDDDLAIVNLERVKRISDTFKPTKTKKKGSVPRNVVEEVWRGRLTPRFFLRLINVMFPEDAREVSFLSFYTIYKNLAEPETEIMFRALTIYHIATIHEPPFNYEQANEYPNASYKSIKDYICDVVTSYLHAAIHIHMKEALGWASLKATNSLIDGNLAASYILKDLETHRNEVSIGGLEVWLEKNEIYYTVSEQLYLFLFGVNKSIDVKPLLPFPDVHASKGLNTILAMTDVLLLNSKLPKRAQRWSLAYIMDTQSNDWESFKQAIYGKRQTIIVIQDANGDIFGMYCPQQWVPSEGFYGSDESFLFTLKPDVNIYDSSGRDNHYQLFTDFGIGMGGDEDQMGLWISSSLYGSTSLECSTFREYWPLSKNLHFKMNALEVWLVTVWEDSTVQKCEMSLTEEDQLATEKDMEAFPLKEIHSYQQQQENFEAELTLCRKHTRQPPLAACTQGNNCSTDAKCVQSCCAKRCHRRNLNKIPESPKGKSEQYHVEIDNNLRLHQKSLITKCNGPQQHSPIKLKHGSRHNHVKLFKEEMAKQKSGGWMHPSLTEEENKKREIGEFKHPSHNRKLSIQAFNQDSKPKVLGKEPSEDNGLHQLSDEVVPIVSKLVQGMGGTLTDPGLFINWSLRVGTTARRCSTYGKYLPLSRDLVFDIRLLELWVVNEALKQKWKSLSRDFYSTVVMWNRIGQNKAKTPQSLQKKLNSDSNVCHEFQKDNVRGKKKVMNREQDGWCHCSKSNCKESTVEIDELGSQEKQSLENFNQTIQEKNNQALKLQKKTFKSFGDSSISHILSDHLPMTPQRTVVVGMSHHELHNPHSPDGDKNEYQHTYPHPIYNTNTTEMSLTMEPLHRSDSMGHNVTHRQTVQIVEPPESSHNETSAMNQQNMSIYEPQPHLSRSTEVSQRGLSVFQPPSPMQRASATSQKGMSVFVPPSRASRASAVSQRGLSMIEPTHQTTRPSALSQQAKSAYVAPQQSTTSQLNMSTYEPIPQTARDWEIDQGRMSFFQPPHVQEMLRAPTQGQSGISVYEQAPVIAANSNPFTSIDFTKQDHQYDLNVNPSEERMQMSGRQSQAYHGEPPAVSGESLEYNNRQSPPTVHHMNARSPSRAVVPAVSNIRAPSPSGYKQTAGRDTSCRLCTCGGKRQCMICYCPKENMANMCTCGGNDDQKDSRGGVCEQNLQIHKGKAKRRSKSKASDKAAKKEAKKREREEKRALKQEKKERKAKDREIRKLSKKSTSAKRKKHGRGKGQHWSPCDCCKCEENAICPCRGQTSSECSDQQKKGCCGRKKKLKKSKKIEKAPNKSKECEDVENKPNEAAGDDQQYCSFPDTPCPGLIHAKEFCECSPYDDRNSCNPSGAIPTRKYGLSVGGQCGDGRQASPSSQRQTVAFAREAENGICNRINCLKNKQSCDCYTTKGICNCNCTSKIRSDPQVFSSLMPPLSVGKGDSQYKFIRNSSQPQFTTLPTTVTPSGNLIINVTKKGGPMGLTNNGENKHFVPPCVLYLDCTKVKDMCVIIRNNQDSPSFPNDSV